MSFITKRERVFNDYDQFELPARNEGKLKSYTSCTDTRAWSHFCSDKSEHLVDIIKRNNQTCRAKYVPTDVIVNTLMAAKNAEISRLKRRIEEFEQMVAAYDQLELTCEQKFEIANAHAAIKQANKELDDLFINLDMSNYTEGLDSDRYQTGQSSEMPGKGDEWQCYKRDEENQCSRFEMFCFKDSSTNAVDPRINELQEELICKDAKLNALQNIKAILENDICEPYCIYAHIYTALEKIFGILCQNDKYKIYLTLMGAQGDNRSIDIKGKIIYKLQILENFNMSLVSHSSYELFPQWQQEFMQNENADCLCESNNQRTEMTNTLTAIELKPANIDRKRAQLVADIMDEDEIGEVVLIDNLAKDSIGDITIDEYNIDKENLKRLKDLQLSYDELVKCHESVKHDRDRLQFKCHRFQELEKECIELRNQLREYNSLWNEKEYYRRRSEELDNLKEQYLILAEESANVETQLKAEIEINHMRSNTIEGLRNLNITLEKKLNEMSLAYEKEKNLLLCQLKEMQCQIMCQEQQIKSLSSQIDRLIDQEHDKVTREEDTTKTLVLLEEVETLKDQIRNFKELLYCNEEEKQHLQDELLDKSKRIDELKIQVENWKCSFNAVKHNQCLEHNQCEQMQELVDENRRQRHELEEKNNVISDLMTVVCEKSQYIHNLLKEIAENKKENEDLLKEIQKTRNTSDQSENIVHIDFPDNVDYNKLKEIITEKEKQVEHLHNELKLQSAKNHDLQQEILKLAEENKCAIIEINSLKDDKNKLEVELQNNRSELLNSHQLGSPQSKNELLEKVLQTEFINADYDKLKEAYNISLMEKEALQSEINHIRVSLNEKSTELSDVIEKLQMLQNKNDRVDKISRRVTELENELKDSKKSYNDVNEEKIKLLQKYDKKIEEFNDLCKAFENKIDENNSLSLQLKRGKENLASLESELAKNKAMTAAIAKQTKTLNEKLKDYEKLAEEFNKLNAAHTQVKSEKDALQNELDKYLEDLKYLENEKTNLYTFKNSLETKQDLDTSALSEGMECQKPYFPYKFILKEINIMKGEKEANHRRIHDLLENLERSEQTIANLTEDLVARDDKIAILENHTNALEDEVRRLHSNLESMINTGEQMKEDYHEISKSLEKMESQHIKATNNVKAELAKLKDENNRLKNQLSFANVKIDASCKDINKYAAQTHNLQRELNAIVDCIKKVEHEVTGQSSLTLENYNTEQVLNSIDQLRIFINLKNAKSISLEKTIHRIQNSSELLISKTDEAKKLFEKEKQIAMAAKEEAIAEMETKLNDLRNQLQEEKTRDANTIKDLEAEIMNQKLIIDKVNKSKQSYIAKIEKEMNNLQNMYQNAIAKVNKLEAENHQYLIEKSHFSELIDDLHKDLENKKKEITDIQQFIREVRYPSESHGVQTMPPTRMQSQSYTQTEKYNHHKDMKNTEVQTFTHELSEKLCQTDETDVYEIKNEKEDENFNINIMKLGHPPRDENQPVRELLPKKHPSKNEVKILSISVDPALDFVRNSYMNYKLSRLSIGNFENFSISRLSHTTSDIEILPCQEQDLLDAPFILDVSDSQPEQTEQSNANNKLFTLTISRSLKSLSKSNEQMNNTESVFDEEYFLVYPDSEDSQTISQYNKKMLAKTPSLNINVNINSKSNQVFKSIDDSSSLQYNIMQEDTIVNTNLDKTNEIVSEEGEKSSSGYEISRIPANYLLVKNENTLELDTDDSKCIEITKESQMEKAPYEYKELNLVKKFKSDNFLRPLVNYLDRAVLVKIDSTNEFENKIQCLTKALETIEKDYKLKLEAVKTQYDANIRNMIKDHNEGVKCMQSLHEETMQDITKNYDNEIGILRGMSLEALRKAQKLEQENLSLKNKLLYTDEEPVKMLSSAKMRRSRRDTAFLTKTNVEAFNVKPKNKNRGPCAFCSSSKLTNIMRNTLQFEDIEKRKQVEQTVLNEIMKKIINGNIENLDKQELLFLHSKVCRQWKKKLGKSDSLTKKINEFESEVISRQRHAQDHIDELNRKVEEEKRRLHEIREMVFIPNRGRSMTGGQEDTFSIDTTTINYETTPNQDPEKYHLLEQTPPDSYQGEAAQKMKRSKDIKDPTKPEYGEPPTRLRKVKTPPQPRPVKKWPADRKGVLPVMFQNNTQK